MQTWISAFGLKLAVPPGAVAGRADARFDERGNAVALRDGRGRWTRYEYERDRLTRVVEPDGAARAPSAAPIAGAGPGPDHLDDERGRCAGLRPAGSTRWLRFDYDDEGSRLVVRADGGPVYAVVSGDVTRFANGVVERRGIDAVGRPDRIAAVGPAGSVLDLGLSYDAEGRISSLGGEPISYEDGRVVGAGSTRIAYDANGSATRRGGARLEVDERDRVTARGDGRRRVSYRYDGEGNRVARRDAAGTTAYRRGGGGTLLAVERDGDPVVRYGYDAGGLRVRREAGATITHLHRDAAGYVVAETDEAGRATATYLWLAGRCVGRIDGPIGDPVAEWFHCDHLGTAWAVTDAAGGVQRRRRGPLDEPGPGPFMGRFADPATGFVDFGCRDYDPETGSFVTADAFTFAPDDPRLAADPRRDPWGRPGPQRAALAAWLERPMTRNRYALCLGDPVNNVDLDGHSAWWFFLTIPSSLIWAIPNTVFALMLVVINLVAEILGWIGWFFYCLFNLDFDLKHYPWGNADQNGPNPTNPFDLSDRDHFWIGFDASARLGVPWAMINGSVPSGTMSGRRAYTLGNVVFIDDLTRAANDADAVERFVVPNDPDVQLNRADALHQHEMTHTFQYAYLGPLFHSLPLPLVERVIENAIEGGDLTERSKWWQHISVGGAFELVVGGLAWLLSGRQADPTKVASFLDPATWWQSILPFRWVEIATQAISFNSQLPLVGVYWLDLYARGGQQNSWFERNAGASSGDVYKTVVEAESDEIVVGQFTRVIGAETRPRVGTAPVPSVSWSTTGTPLTAATVIGAAPPLSVTAGPHLINLDSVNSGAVKVVNATGIYFHATAVGSYTVTGTSANDGTAESVEITVKDVAVQVATSVTVCASQTIAVGGDPAATYTAQLKPGAIGSGAPSVAGLSYTAGASAGTDTIQIVARYQASGAPFTKYGDNGLAGFGYVVKEVDIAVAEPTITQAANEVVVGGAVSFTVDSPPQSVTVSGGPPSTQFDRTTSTFVAGRGPIDVDSVATITFDYGCTQFAKTVTVKPLIVTIDRASVHSGEPAQVSVGPGATAPFRFALTVNASGGSIDQSGRYRAGTVTSPATDEITVTDRFGAGGRGRVTIRVDP